MSDDQIQPALASTPRLPWFCMTPRGTSSGVHRDDSKPDLRGLPSEVSYDPKFTVERRT